MASNSLMAKTAPQLRDSIERMKARSKSLAEKAKRPLIQGGMGVSAVAGGAAGGLVAGMKPAIAGIPTDAIAGAVIAVPCLMGAGNPAVDAAAFLGWGMLAGAAGRTTHDLTRDWREQRAADGGETAAKNIVAAQKNLDSLRKAREESSS